MGTEISYSGKPLFITREHEKARWQRIVLLCIIAYEALGCFSGGILLIAAPDGRLMNMPVEIMHGVFRNFLIPGIILFCLGILNAAAFFSVLKKKENDWVLAGLAMGGLGIWFWIEIAILRELHWLHAMWGLPVVFGILLTIPLIPPGALLKASFICGILSSLLYIAINIIVPRQWPEYDIASQTPSELSAIGAPTRFLWNVLALPYLFLMFAFSWGVWKSARENRRLRLAGIAMMIYSLLGLLWPFAPMHLRETLAAGGGTFSDTMHLILAAITQVCYFTALIFAAFALGKTFRIFSVITLIVLLFFGVLTFMEAPGLSKNESTPMIGVWERINIGVFLIWVVALSTVLWRREQTNTGKAG